jgi:hypothetical protein
MKGPFASESPKAPETEAFPSEAQIDALYLKLAAYEESGREAASVVYGLLGWSGLDIPLEAIEAGSLDIDGIPRDIRYETDHVGTDGSLNVDVSVRDRLARVRGETLDFKRRYSLKASPAALEARREAEERVSRERVTEKEARRRQINEALAVFRPFAKTHLGQTFTSQEWASNEHGLRGLFIDEIPEGCAWTISPEGNGRYLRVTITQADGSVYDVYEFDAE